jgi:hypothetical protein
LQYEKPQKGNPNSVTVNQHTFPAASVARFVGPDGCVEVHLIEQIQRFKAKPSDQIFCAKRVWDQRAENGYMKDIEDKYQTFAESVVLRRTVTVARAEQEVVTDMFALWNIRNYRKDNPIEDVALDGVVAVLPETTKDDREKLEMKHVSTIRNDKTIPGRQICGFHIQRNLMQIRKQLGDASWGIVRACEGEFIVPDNCRSLVYLPVSPELCFLWDCEDRELSVSEVASINKSAIAGSRMWYFARELPKG